MRPFRQIFFVLSILVIFTVIARDTRANGLAFSVTPMISDLTIAPGATQTGIIEINDNAAVSTSPLDVKVTVEDWTLDPTGKASYSSPGTTTGSCASWIQVTPLELSLNGSGPVMVRYSITVPADAQGSYHCIVFFTTAPIPARVNGNSANLTAMIGNTIYVQVGPAVHRAKITDLSLTQNSVSMTVQNTGSSYLRLGGLVKIADSAGKIVQQVQIPGDAVLPGTDSTRIVPIQLSSSLASGDYLVTALLDYGGDALLGARINATLP